MKSQTQHNEWQRSESDLSYSGGSRPHVTSSDPLVSYIVRWRLQESLDRLAKRANGRISPASKILVMCAGEGGEGSILCDMGYGDVTISDLSSVGVETGLKRDYRLKGLVLDAENADVPDRAFDLVIVQDGLHHLQNPVRGFAEMLRIARVGVIFLEPHDSWVGNFIGTKWEKNGDAINYVFRWTTKLVQDCASSYLGPDACENMSFSFWHHNIVYEKIGKLLGGGTFALWAIRILKRILDGVAGKMGNQFAGVILKRQGI